MKLLNKNYFFILSLCMVANITYHRFYAQELDSQESITNGRPPLAFDVYCSNFCIDQGFITGCSVDNNTCTSQIVIGECFCDSQPIVDHVSTTFLPAIFDEESSILVGT